MPRKSVDALTTAPDVTGRRTQRLRPDPSLPVDVGVIFNAAVAAAPASHFSELDRVALTEFAQAAARCRRAEAAVAEQGDVVNNKPNPWLLVLRDARHQVTALLPKLRLCPSARIQAKQVKEAAPGSRPWDYNP